MLLPNTYPMPKSHDDHEACGRYMRLIEGAVDHECMHCKHTKFEVLDSIENDPMHTVVHGYLNLVEDVRGEEEFILDLPGCNHTLHGLVSELAAIDGIKRVIAGDPPAKMLSDYLVGYGYIVVRNHPDKALRNANAGDRQIVTCLFGEDLIADCEALLDTAPTLGDTWGSLDLARQIIDRIKEEAHLAPDADAGDDANDSQTSNDKEDVSDASSGGNSGDSDGTDSSSSSQDSTSGDEGDESATKGSSDGGDDKESSDESDDASSSSKSGDDTGDNADDSSGNDGDSEADANKPQPSTEQRRKAAQDVLDDGNAEHHPKDMGELSGNALKDEQDKLEKQGVTFGGGSNVTRVNAPDWWMTNRSLTNGGTFDHASARVVSNQLRMKLIRELNAMSIARTSHHERGSRLDTRRLHRVFTERKPRVFQRRAPAKHPDMDVFVLVDGSGSMRLGQRDQLACQAAYVAALAFEPIRGVNVAVGVFPDWEIFTQLGEAPRVERFRPVSSGECTPLPDAMQWGAQALFAGSGRRKLMLVLCDGATHDHGVTRELEASGIEVRGIGIQCPMDHIIPQSVTIQDVNELPNAVLTVIRKDLLASMNVAA